MGYHKSLALLIGFVYIDKDKHPWAIFCRNVFITLVYVNLKF